MSLPEPESIFKHLCIVSAREVTPSLPTLCVTQKGKKRHGRRTVHWMLFCTPILDNSVIEELHPSFSFFFFVAQMDENQLFLTQFSQMYDYIQYLLKNADFIDT